MSVPSIPGYIRRDPQSSLFSEWNQPRGEYPGDLWPSEAMQRVQPAPTGWLTIEENFFSAEAHGGTGCILVPSNESSGVLTETTWTGRNLGSVGTFHDGKFFNGLVNSDTPNTEFFVQARRASGSKLPEIEVAYPFLWYWDAFSTDDGWQYLNDAGREQELIRYERSQDSWSVKVRSLEFRSFLAAYGKSAIVQIDHVTKVAESQFERIDDEYTSDWARFSFHAAPNSLTGGRSADSRLVGQYAVSGLRTSRVPRGEGRQEDREFPSFIYGIDAETGKPKIHGCNPDELGSYFDADGTRLHYLTPVYFKREVLQPYSAEPSRYRVSPGRLSCLDLWGITISVNNAGLVEAYLGDLGRDLPADEWGHWRTYNVPPEGQMDEGRFRRDFLGQWASSSDPVRDLRDARMAANDAARVALDGPLWRDVPQDLAAEYDSLMGPLSSDPSSLGAPLLVLTKVFVDALDPTPLKRALEHHDKGEQSLRLLERYLTQKNKDDDSSQILRDLQAFRSRGGIAHLSNSQSEKAAIALGVANLAPLEAFSSIVIRLTLAMNNIATLLSQVAASSTTEQEVTNVSHPLP